MKILFITLLNLSILWGVNVKTYIPIKAYRYMPLVFSEVKTFMPNFKSVYYFGSLIEQESCIHLKHRRCWDPTSELKTRREQGVGFGQITRAFRKNGRVRFDTLGELKRKYPKYFRGVNWSNLKRRPKAQIRGIVLLWRRNYRILKRIPGMTELDRIAFADAAYNGGYGGVNRDRSKCKLRRGCNPKKWFKNVEYTCSKSTRALYGNRSACDINREHVYNTLRLRMGKYTKYYFEKYLKLRGYSK